MTDIELDNPHAGSVAIVLGATTAVGKAVAQQLVQAGATVALVEIAGTSTGHTLEAVAREVETSGHGPLTAEIAPRDTSGFAEFVRRVVERHGRLDVLVTVPVVQRPVVADEMADGDWNSGIDRSLSAAYCAYRSVLPHFEATGRGRIVSVVGDEGRRGAGGASHIAAGAWGVIGLAKSAALEMAEADIAVNVVTSTAIDDDRWHDEAHQRYAVDAVGHEVDSLDVHAAAEALGLRHPTNRPFVAPDAVARAVLMFISQPDNTMTGSVLDLSQGMAALNTA
jgi:NAD(P)-dependent dehydrogenase (short-subunit alcohol dehydrogenase family)